MTQEDKTYNGWTNKETWLVALWIDNDGYAGGSLGVSEQADEIAEESMPADDDLLHEVTGKLADWLEERITEDLGEHKGLLADIVGTALGRVDWREIAEHYAQDAVDAALEGAKEAE